MLFLIGLGLGNHNDITLRGLEAIKTCERVYLESYTSVLISANADELEKLYGKSITIADREMVEQDSDTILSGADQYNVAFLVVGDPFGYQYCSVYDGQGNNSQRSGFEGQTA